MRKNLIRGAILALIFVGTLLTTSCVAEDSFVDHHHHRMDIKRKGVNLKDLQSKPELKRVLSTLFNSEEGNKMVFDSINQFWVNDEKGVYLEDGGYHSYTFDY